MPARSRLHQLPRGEFRRILVAMATLIVTMAVLLAGLALPVIGGAGLVSRVTTVAFRELPDEFEPVSPSQQSELLAADGSSIAKFYAENRIVVDLDQISPWLRKAAVAIEDHRFYEHHGVDLEGNVRAVVNNLFGRATQGASTLTQQYVKNTLIEIGLQNGDDQAVRDATEQTIQRKLREAKYATTLERKYSKDEILAGYLNIAPFGPNVYGAEAASQHYFSKPASELTLAEGALLAGLTQSPTAYDPLQHPDSAQARRNTVLAAMLNHGDITQAEYDEARAIPVADLLHPSTEQQGCAAAGAAGYFCSYVVYEIYTNPIYGKTLSERRRLLLRGGLKIKTTLQPEQEAAAQESIEAQVPKNDPSNVKIGLVSIEPGTGKITAMAQNTTFSGTASDEDPSATEVSFTVDKAHGGGAGYQPGSSYKVFTLAAWLDAGKSAYASVGGRTHYSASDFKATCPEATTSEWNLKNATRGTEAATSVLTATQKSLNTGFADMSSQLDLCDILKFARQTGAVPGDGSFFTKDHPFTPAAILGSGSVTPLNMANAYATFVNDGKYCSPIAIEAITDGDGNELDVPQADCRQAIEESTARKVVSVLNSVYNSYGSQTAIGRPAMTKTGTTDEAEAAWLVGAVPQLATAVWVGHSEGLEAMTNIRINGRYYPVVFGSTVPSAAWKAYMARATSSMERKDFNPTSLGGSQSRLDRSRPAPTKSQDEGSPDNRNNEGEKKGDNQQ